MHIKQPDTSLQPFFTSDIECAYSALKQRLQTCSMAAHLQQSQAFTHLRSQRCQSYEQTCQRSIFFRERLQFKILLTYEQLNKLKELDKDARLIEHLCLIDYCCASEAIFLASTQACLGCVLPPWGSRELKLHHLCARARQYSLQPYIYLHSKTDWHAAQPFIEPFSSVLLDIHASELLAKHAARKTTDWQEFLTELQGIPVQCALVVDEAELINTQNLIHYAHLGIKEFMVSYVDTDIACPQVLYDELCKLVSFWHEHSFIARTQDIPCRQVAQSVYKLGDAACKCQLLQHNNFYTDILSQARHHVRIEGTFQELHALLQAHAIKDGQYEQRTHEQLASIYIHDISLVNLACSLGAPLPHSLNERFVARHTNCNDSAHTFLCVPSISALVCTRVQLSTLYEQFLSFISYDIEHISWYEDNQSLCMRRFAHYIRSILGNIALIVTVPLHYSMTNTEHLLCTLCAPENIEYEQGE